jgi:uncharacterized repeat protein (TIGR01451 family)
MDSYNPNGIWTSKQPKTAVPVSETPTTPKSPAPIGKEIEPPKSGNRFWLIGTIAVVAILVVVGAIFYLLRPAPAPAVAITFTKPDQALIGDPFPFSVTVSNLSPAVLKNAVLVIQLPSNVSFVGAPQGQQTMTWPLGDIASGTAIAQSSTLIATGGPQSVAPLSVQVKYVGAAQKTSLETDASTSVAIGEPAVSATIAVPSDAVSGSNITLILSYANRSPDVIPGVAFVFSYPPAFTFATSSIVPVGSGNDTWNVGDLAPDASGTITLQGILNSATEAAYPFTCAVKTTVQGQGYAFAGPTANVALQQAPLSLSIMADGSSSYVSAPGDFLSYSLDYANHSSVGLQGVTISAKLTGAMFDFSSIDTNGSFNSLANTITWSPSVVPALISLAPGVSGQVLFRVRTLKNFPIRRASDKNYTLQVGGTIISSTVPPGIVASSTVSHMTLMTKMRGVVEIASQGYRYDTVSSTLNTGPFPPIVDRETQYTIHWIVTDTATDLENVVVTSTLPTGVSFTGAVWSNVSTTPQYDPATGVIVWQIPSVPATAGIVAQAPQTIFQVAATPAVNQVGQFLSLLGPTTVQATDAFTGEPLQASADAMTTDLRNDPVAAQNHNPTVRAQ